MNRRQFLAAGGTAVLGSVAGCLGGGGSSGDADGYGPEVDSTPEERSIDTDSYERYSAQGTEVPLVPIDDAYYWYQRREARVADARGSDQYDRAHVAGAVLSPASGDVSDDPVTDWDQDERIVTYCGCPHHLSGLRAAALIQNGYEEVYAIDEGFQAWIDRDYPLEGSGVQSNLESYEIRGMSDPAHAGEMVWLEQLDAERYEAAPIEDDGSYRLTLHYDGAEETRFGLEAPDYELEATLAALTSDVVTG